MANSKKSNFLNRHLNDCSESYLEHLLFSLAITFWLFIAVLTLFIHSFLPFLFEKKSSRHVKKINQIMQIRLSKSNLRDRIKTKVKKKITKN